MAITTAIVAGEGFASMPRGQKPGAMPYFTALLRPLGPDVGRALGERLNAGQLLSEWLLASLTGAQLLALRTTLMFRGLELRGRRVTSLRAALRAESKRLR